MNKATEWFKRTVQANLKKQAASLDSSSRDFSPEQLRAQIGGGNILAISGGRVESHSNGIRLPVAYGYAVDIFLEENDTYTVQTTFTRSGVTKVKYEWTGIYADQVGEAAYQASLYRDLKYKNSSKTAFKPSGYSDMTGACDDGSHDTCKLHHPSVREVAKRCLCKHDSHDLARDDRNLGGSVSGRDKSGACEDGDHSTCKMTHGVSMEWCMCRNSSHGVTASRKTANRNLMYVPDDGGGAIPNSDGLSLSEFVEYLRDLGHEGGYITNQDGGRKNLDAFGSRKTAKGTPGAWPHDVDQDGDADSMLDDVTPTDDNADQQAMWPWEIGEVKESRRMVSRKIAYGPDIEGREYPLPIGATISWGNESQAIITGLTYTAYEVVVLDKSGDGKDGYKEFVPFAEVHPKGYEEPLATFGSLNVWAQNGNADSDLDDVEVTDEQAQESMFDEGWAESASKTALNMKWVVLQRGTFTQSAGPFDSESEALYAAFELNLKWNTNDYVPMEVNYSEPFQSESARSDYDEWNEEADIVWLEEEGRHGEDSGMSKDDYLEQMSDEDYDIDDIANDGYYASKTSEWYDEVDDDDDDDSDDDAVEDEESPDEGVKDIEKDALREFTRVVQANMMEMR